MSYQHGITVKEVTASDSGSVQSTAGVHVVVGVAPVNLANDPYGVTNIPILLSSFEKAKEFLGYTEDFENYNLSEAMFAYFKLVRVAPVVFINVLDPQKHNTEINEIAEVQNSQAAINIKGILLDTIAVSSDENPLVKETDYIASFDEEGNVVLSIINGKTYTSLTFKAKKIDPSVVTDADIVGGYNAQSGEMTGIELVRSVYPKFGKFASIIIAPGYTSAVVAAALQAKTTDINGGFSSETIIDIKEETSLITAIQKAKENAVIVSPHAMAVWPKVMVDDRVINFSTVLGAVLAYYDAENDDVPCLTPSNKPIVISGTCNENGTEIYIDQLQANALNGIGIVTAINLNGWRIWGNNTAAFPDITEPKDRWIGCRRFFSWMENRFIITYLSRVDSLENYRLIEQIIEDENQFCSSLVADGKCAGAYIEYNSDENSLEQLESGKIVFHQYLAPYPPAESIENTFEFDTSLLKNSLITIGGES